MRPGNPGDVISRELAAAMEKARTEFANGRWEWHPPEWLDELLSRARETEDCKCILDALAGQLQRVETWRNQLQDLLSQATAIIAKQEQQERYTERWWRRRRKIVYEACREGKDKGLREILVVYAEALVAWALEICAEIAVETYPLPSIGQTLDVLRYGTEAIRSGNYHQALDLVTMLSGSSDAQAALDPDTRAVLTVFKGRIHLWDNSPELALGAFNDAQELTPNDGKPFAALGDYHRIHGNAQTAEQLYREASERSPSEPDGYIGMGLLVESKGHWDEADDWYERAIETKIDEPDPVVSLDKMLAPLSGNFYLQLARSLKAKNPERALNAVTKAISEGVKLDGAYPERVAYRIQAEILERLDRKKEAAAAYFDAGSRFVYRKENQIAVDLLEQARQLDPGSAPTDWYLADALYVTSWTPEYPYVRKEPLLRAIEVWEARIERELPDAEYAWAYVTRAVICEQETRLPDADREALWWQGAACLERSILVASSVQAYSTLGRIQRNLSMEANALEATRKAVELSPQNLQALDERAAILTNVGQFDDAEATIDARRQIDPNPWADAVKVYLLTRRGRFAEALALITTVIEKEPTDFWYRFLSALCNRMLHRFDDARRDYKWIWERYDPKDANALSYFGSAAFYLENIDDATRIFENLLGDPSQDPVSVNWNLTECYAAKADFPRAEESFKRCLASILNPRQPMDLVNLGIAPLREYSRSWPHGAEVQKMLATFEEKIDVRKQTLGNPPSPIDEMNTVLKTTTGCEVSWKRVAASAALGRLYGQQERWAEALAIYRQLEGEPRRFPEARLGIQNVESQAGATA